MSDISGPEDFGRRTTALDEATAIPRAPLWRRSVARTIDLTVVFIAFALFLTPVIATHTRPASSLLRASGWVYLGVFVALAVTLALSKTRGRRLRHEYVTVGMSIMDLRPLPIANSTRIVRGRYLPETEGAKRGRAAALIIVPLIVLGLALFLFELAAFT
jgi:hypothetical protein